MSTSSQNNGKKSSNSSIVNTPSSTPVTHIANGSTQMNPQSSPPPNNAPKYGTLVPNRIFVGGISANTTEGELMQLFSSYGTVKAAKIIQDRAGVSKGYGFITFESEDDAKRPLREAENIVLRERKLNIAPAIKKQPFSRAFDASSPTAVAPGNPAPFFFPPGTALPYFQGGVAYYPQPNPSAAAGDLNGQQPVYQPPAVYPTQTGPPQTAAYPSMMFPAQTIYMPQQYPMPIPYDYNFYQTNGGPPSTQYLLGNQGGPGGPQCAPMQPSTSPPRPSCYSQQMPAYNPADSMFYNLPVYATPLEGQPVYSEAYDLAAAGPYTEDNYNNMADNTTSQDIDSSTAYASNSTITQNIHHHASTPQLVPTSNDTSIDKAQSRLTEDVPNARNMHTPVVSLLSIDQQQEKDYSSMQSGRRRKLLHQNSISVQHVYPTNGYLPNSYPIGYHTPPPPHSYGAPYNGYQPTAPPYDYRRTNGYDNRMNRNKKRMGRTNDHSSRSSLRTDSNSSASCVDENKNEDKTHARTSVNTPPPAPYSPMTHQQFKIITNSNARNYQHSTRYNYNNNYCRPNYDTSKTDNFTTKPKILNNSSVSPDPPQSSVPTYQVHVSATQSFVPQQGRRNKRGTVRRGGSSGLNEIGAGDAPLPGDVDGEVCKKLETLKL